MLTDQPFNVELKKFVPQAQYTILPNDNGVAILDVMMTINDNVMNLLLVENEMIEVGNYIISFNPHIDGFINFYQKNNMIYVKTKEQIDTLKMALNERNVLEANATHPFEPKMLHKVGIFNFVLKGFYPKGKIYLTPSEDRQTQKLDALVLDITMNNNHHEFMLFGKKGFIAGYRKDYGLDHFNISLSYGSKVIRLPFSLYLNDFILERYPGSNSPSAYRSEIVLIDREQGLEENRSIFMNNILEHRGYRFYQSSYDPDEGGTILSVNKDLTGTIITYIGYFLLCLGMVANIFSPKSRFVKLYKKLHNKNLSLWYLVALSLLIGSTTVYSDTHTRTTRLLNNQLQQNMDQKKDMIAMILSIDKDHAKAFSRLTIQSQDGRMKPINTLSREVIRKITSQDNFSDIYPNVDLTSDQVLLGMLGDALYMAKNKAYSH